MILFLMLSADPVVVEGWGGKYGVGSGSGDGGGDESGDEGGSVGCGGGVM